MAGNRIKGVTIEIGGDTTKLTDSLKDVDKQLSTTQSNLRDINKLLKLDPKSTELLKQKQEQLSKAVKLSKDRVSELEKAQKQMGDRTDENASQYDALERELVEARKKTEDYKDQLKKTSTEADTLNIALSKVGDAAKTVSEKTKGLSTAAAGGLAALGGAAVNAAAMADDLNTLSKQTGFSTAELQKFSYASDRIDVSMEAITSSARKMKAGMEKNVDTYKDLGVALYDTEGNFRSTNDIFFDTVAALSRIQDGTERDLVSMQLFGKGADELAGIIDDGGEALRQMGQEAEDSGLILSQDALDGANAFGDGLDTLKAKAQQSFFSVGATLAENLLPAMEDLVETISNVLSWIASLDGNTLTLIGTILAVVAAISPVAGLISTIIGAMTALSGVLGVGVGVIAGVGGAITAVIAIGVLLWKNWDTIKEKASQLLESIKETFEKIKNSIGEKIEGAKEKVSSGIEAIKGLFRFKWEWPKMTLPHFSVAGSLNPLNWLKDGLPKISVDWYAKAMNNGMILNGATIFGMRNGSLLGGGEAGSEVVVGTNSLMNMIRNATNSTVTAPINLTVTVNGNVDDPEVFARDLATRLSDLIKTESEVFA